MPLVLLLIAALVLVQAPVAIAEEARRVDPVRAVRIDAPIKVDGVLDEDVWQNGHAVTDLRQRNPIEDAEPTERTEVRVAYDDHAIYVAARMYDANPDSIIARLGRRDNAPPSDQFTVAFDPLFDRRTGYYFTVNAAGVLTDGTLFNDNWDDSSWDGVWEGRARRDDQGWTAELRIPFSQMRVRTGSDPVWGINFSRTISRKSENDFLVYTPSNASGFVSRFPELHGLQTNGTGRYAEFRPYVTSKGEYLQVEDGNPFNDGSRFQGDIGGDLRVGVGRNLTLNATVNPDFGQVEIDPAVVNLSDVETFFQEKRPFFVEGANIFRFGQEGGSDYWNFNFQDPKFFHSRRIGRSPQGRAPSADFADVPLGTTILGAGKLTGRAGGINLGTMHAVTARERAKLQSGASRWDAEVEPMSYYGVARGQKQFNDSRQGLGVMTTLAARSFDDDATRDAVASSALMGGVDGWTFLDEDKVWVLSGWAAGSHVAGNETFVTGLQRSSRRYYQRPDAGHVRVDPNATSLTGGGARLWLNKERGNVMSNSAFGIISPGFEINDLGFQTRADVINGHIGGGYKWTKTNSWKKHANAGGGIFATGDFDGNVTAKGFHSWQFVEFINNYSLNTWGGYSLERDDTRRTRGGPVMIAPAAWDVGVYFDTDGKSKVFMFGDAGVEGDAENSRSWWIAPGIELKPMSNFSVRVGPSFNRNMDRAQYVTTVSDPLATETFGARYIFGELEQTTVAANIRINVAFTPNLSLQTFIQPLVSAGEYRNLKELARPRSYEFNEYGANYDPATGMVDPDGAGPAAPFAIDNPDFNFKSLRGNAVLRWEYMPGSTFFLVWTQIRRDFEERGAFDFGRDSERLFDRKPDNVFLAKVSYYFTL